MEQGTYLDHNASTPVRPEAAAAVADVLSLTGNPSSVHRFGRVIRRRIEDARDAVAALVGARPEHVVFTSGGTEANNLALNGSGALRVLVSAVEHPSVLSARDDAEAVPVDADGVVRLDVLSAMLEGRGSAGSPVLVSVMYANNETGVIQPVAAVADLVRRHGGLVHCDAVQAPARVALDMGALGVHMLSLSSHKMGGPSGVGALVLSEDTAIDALIKGGGQERGRRSGTEDAAGIAGFGAAAAAVVEARGDMERMTALRDRLERRIRQALPGVSVYGADVPRLGNTSCLGMPGVDAETQVMAFDLDGIAVSAGSACSSGKVAASHVLKAMGIGDADAASAIRVSLGWGNDEHDVDRFCDAWIRLQARAGENPNRPAQPAA